MYTKKSLRPLVLKTDVTLVKTLRLIILDFLPGIHSPVIGACLKLSFITVILEENGF